MEKYNDFALGTENFERMAKEYENKKTGEVLETKKDVKESQDFSSLQKQLDYLQNLLAEIKRHTTNSDVLLVLKEIEADVKKQIENINSLFKNNITSQSAEEPETVLFCNNLKLAIQTANDIIKNLVGIKDDEKTSGETKLALTSIINAFIEINNKLVSLFGECRYRTFSLFKNRKKF